MSTDSSGSLKIAWWNTGIAPPVRGKSPKVPSESLQAGIVRLCSECDLTILGEYVDQSAIRDIITGQNKVWLDCCQSRRGVRFTIGAFYDKDSIEIVERPYTIADSNAEGIEGKYRIAQRLVIKHKPTNKLIVVYVVHWTQYGQNEDSFNKREAAYNLSMDMKEFKGRIPYIICMGDFNLEPYDEIMAHMGASREREYTVKRGGMYNPFWRRLAECGTINYVNHGALKCSAPTFDQILLSQEFLLSDLSIESRVLNDYYSPSEGEHWPIQLILTANKIVQEDMSCHL